MGLKSVISVPVYLRQIGLGRSINMIHDVSRILLMSLSQFDGIMRYREDSCYVIKRITYLVEFIEKFFSLSSPKFNISIF